MAAAASESPYLENGALDEDEKLTADPSDAAATVAAVNAAMVDAVGAEAVARLQWAVIPSIRVGKWDAAKVRKANS